MTQNNFIQDCKDLLAVIETRKGLQATCSAVPILLNNYEKNEKIAEVIDAHAGELRELLHNERYSFMGKDAVIPRVYDVEKRIEALLKKAGIRIGSSDTSERIRERKHLEKITDEEER